MIDFCTVVVLDFELKKVYLQTYKFVTIAICIKYQSDCNLLQSDINSICN